MSHDVFEDRLRAELRGATEAEASAFLDIDPAEVLGTGRRVVRRRRMALAGGTLAAVTVLGAGSWAVLDGSADRAVQEVPATRTGAPDGVAPDVVSTTLTTGRGGAVPVYTVRLERASGRVGVTVTSPDGVTKDFGDVGRVPTSGSGAVFATLSQQPFVAVGVVPADADHLVTRFAGGDLGGTTTEEGPLTTTRWKAFLVHSEKSPGGATLSGLAYGTGGRVFTAAGTELPAAAFGDRTVYVDEGAGEIGLLEPDGSATRPLPAAGSGDLPHLVLGRGEGEAQRLVTTTSVVVPIGAQDVTVRVAAGATLRSTETRPLLGGSGLAVVAVAEAPASTSPVVTRVAWTVDGTGDSWDNPD